jgi:hypothetical protein
MKKTEYLLVVLAEEGAEVAQRASKAIRFGLLEVQPGQEETNVRRLERELADVMATAELLGLKVRDEDKAAKREKLKKYMGYSQQIGTLENQKVEHCKSPYCVGDDRCQCQCRACLSIVNF